MVGSDDQRERRRIAHSEASEDVGETTEEPSYARVNPVGDSLPHADVSYPVEEYPEDFWVRMRQEDVLPYLWCAIWDDYQVSMELKEPEFE